MKEVENKDKTRKCNKQMKFVSQKLAEKWGEKLNTKSGFNVNDVYYCDQCKAWHLTSINKVDRQLLEQVDILTRANTLLLSEGIKYKERVEYAENRLQSELGFNKKLIFDNKILRHIIYICSVESISDLVLYIDSLKDDYKEGLSVILGKYTLQSNYNDFNGMKRDVIGYLQEMINYKESAICQH